MGMPDKSLFIRPSSSRKATDFADQTLLQGRVHNEKSAVPKDFPRQNFTVVTRYRLSRYFATLFSCASSSRCCLLTTCECITHTRSSLVATRSGFRNPSDIWMRDSSNISHPFFRRPKGTQHCGVSCVCRVSKNIPGLWLRLSR